MSQIYAMDTFFTTSLGNYALASRCQILSELGYDGTHLTVWDADTAATIPHFVMCAQQHKLTVNGIYFMLDIANPAAAQATIAQIASIPVTTTVEVAMLANGMGQHRSDTSFDSLALTYLQQICAIASQHGHQVVLYPHVNFWLETTDDALRICQQVNHPNLGISFNAYHWYAMGNRDINATTTSIAPYLRAANICGSRMNPPGSAMPASIELIDQGELDLFVVLCALNHVGYTGAIGLQGFGIGGDVYSKLRHSRQVFRDLHHRAALRGHWAHLQ
ncbi:MAG: TIM barrel protein [Chloroflexales bacterium]|nr:TIM barrel protein [Chloroflexales bacterium]